MELHPDKKEDVSSANVVRVTNNATAPVKPIAKPVPSPAPKKSRTALKPHDLPEPDPEPRDTVPEMRHETDPTPIATPRANDIVPDSFDREGEELVFRGKWQGSYKGRRATLQVDRQDDERGTFSGTLVVTTDGGPVHVSVTGYLRDENSAPQVELVEKRVLRKPTTGTWEMSRQTGVLTSEGALRATHWSFSR